MAGSQKQSATEGSTAVQASGDVHITNGLTPAQMSEILLALSSHVEKLGSLAREEVERRLDVFEAGILERFAEDDTARSEAFGDPDFLAATLDAQKAYARSGDDGLRKVLTDLVAKRSKLTERSRVSLSLNDAIAKVGSIPEPDLNALSLNFLFKKVKNTGIVNIQTLANYYHVHAMPLLSNISTTESSVIYLAAHGCLIPSSGIATLDSAIGILKKTYGAVIAKGVTEEEMRAQFPDYDFLVSIGLVIESPFEIGLKVFSICGEQLESKLSEIGVFGHYSEKYEQLMKEKFPTSDELERAMSSYFPTISNLFATYDNSNIKNSRLTSIGTALAHANLASSGFDNADLSIWITE